LLQSQFLHDGRAEEALFILKKQPLHESPFLRHLLRYHEPEGVDDQKEIDARDSFDFLLAYFSLLEIATLAGFLPTALPEEEKQFALAVLDQPNVRKYYTTNYPLLLPKLYRLRLQYGIAPEATDGGAIPRYQQFLTIVEWQRSDEDMETFLWFLDSGYFGDDSVGDLVAILSKAGAYTRSLLRERSRTPLDKGVAGYGKFLALCLMLDSLLEDTAQWPLVQSGMFHFYDYWLSSLRRNAGNVLKPTLQAMQEWNLKQNPEMAEAARQELQSAHEKIGRLLRANYAKPLRQASYRSKKQPEP